MHKTSPCRESLGVVFALSIAVLATIAAYAIEALPHIDRAVAIPDPMTSVSVITLLVAIISLLNDLSVRPNSTATH